MNIIRVSNKEYRERKQELEELVLNRKDAICIVGENGEDDKILIDKNALVKILVNNEKANEFAMELTFGNESYEEVLDSIDKQIEDKNTKYYSHEEFWKNIRDEA